MMKTLKSPIMPKQAEYVPIALKKMFIASVFFN